MTDVQEVLDALNELLQDTTVPRNIKTKIESAAKALQEKSDISMRVNKALHELDELADDTNLQSYTRTQIWGVVSLLETVC